MQAGSYTGAELAGVLDSSSHTFGQTHYVHPDPAPRQAVMNGLATPTLTSRDAHAA